MGAPRFRFGGRSAAPGSSWCGRTRLGLRSRVASRGGFRVPLALGRLLSRALRSCNSFKTIWCMAPSAGSGCTAAPFDRFALGPAADGWRRCVSTSALGRLLALGCAFRRGCCADASCAMPCSMRQSGGRVCRLLRRTVSSVGAGWGARSVALGSLATFFASSAGASGLSCSTSRGVGIPFLGCPLHRRMPPTLVETRALALLPARPRVLALVCPRGGALCSS